jgi:hypothetical protein
MLEMADIKLYTLQSGYVCGYDTHLVKNIPDQVDDINNAVRLNSHKLPDQEYGFNYSPAVDQLYNQYVNRPDIIKSFGFKNQIFEISTSLMLRSGILYFVSLQENSTHLTSVHLRFLEDVIRFIVTGKQQINMITWMRMIKIDDSGLIERTVDMTSLITDLARGATGAIGAKLDVNRLNTNTVLIDWVSQPGGLENLLLTMKIIFGNNKKPMLLI